MSVHPQAATTPPPPPSATRPTKGTPRGLVVALWCVTITVIFQAALAGGFLSGSSGARAFHLIVGWLLAFAAIGIALLAGVMHARRRCPPGLALAVYPLPVLLWFQGTLGHLPMAVSVAVHVPLGVLLAVYPAVVAVRLSTRGMPPRA